MERTRIKRNQIRQSLEEILKDGRKGFRELYRELCDMVSSHPSFSTVKSILDLMPNVSFELASGRGLPKKVYYLQPNPALTKIELEKKKLVNRLILERRSDQSIRTILLHLGKIATRDEELMTSLITDTLVSALDSYEGIHVKSRGTWDIKGNDSDLSPSQARQICIDDVVKKARQRLNSQYGLNVQEGRIKKELHELMSERLVYFGNLNYYGFMFDSGFADLLEKMNSKVKERYAVNLPGVHFALYLDKKTGEYELPGEYRPAGAEEQEVTFED